MGLLCISELLGANALTVKIVGTGAGVDVGDTVELGV
jgi:hypothetical protein